MLTIGPWKTKNGGQLTGSGLLGFYAALRPLDRHWQA